jgi:hypothetical protein
MIDHNLAIPCLSTLMFFAGTQQNNIVNFFIPTTMDKDGPFKLSQQ